MSTSSHLCSPAASIAAAPPSSLDMLGCGVLGRDSDAIVRYANERLLSWTGYTRDDLIGRHVGILIPAELDTLAHEELRSVDAGDLRARLTILRRKDTTTFPVLALPQYQRSDDPAAIHCAVVVDLGAMQTAKPANVAHTDSLRTSLERVCRELQTIVLLSDAVGTAATTLSHPALATLSPREREVLAQLLRGLRVAMIGRTLHVSPHTVRNHLKAIFQKLGVNSQSEVTALVNSLVGHPVIHS